MFWNFLTRAVKRNRCLIFLTSVWFSTKKLRWSSCCWIFEIYWILLCEFNYITATSGFTACLPCFVVYSDADEITAAIDSTERGGGYCSNLQSGSTSLQIVWLTWSKNREKQSYSPWEKCDWERNQIVHYAQHPYVSRTIVLSPEQSNSWD
jgi:hypothetical protein